MTDQADRDAEAMLPCNCGGVFVDGIIDSSQHDNSGECPAYYRSTVAAKLRERDEHWTQVNDRQRMVDAAFYTEIIKKRDQEIERLKAENAARLELLHKAVTVTRDWHNMGMEPGHNALKIWQIYWNNAPEMKDIQLEIDRAKGEKT